MRKKLSRQHLVSVLAGGVLIAAVAGGIVGYLTIRDQLTALDTRLEALTAKQDARDEEGTAAPLPPPISHHWRWPESETGRSTTSTFTCDPSSGVRYTDDRGGDDHTMDKWETAAYLTWLERLPNPKLSDLRLASWLRDCTAALGWAIP